ncbi:MAG: MBL fold metallo-hydrolase [Deltaproteobacteria bacterium]|nr:MBL fold metallo-hydrolase [Deltaproteobacteria bacterium]
MRVVDDLFAYVWRGRDNNCNSYVFARALADGKHVLIDPGHVTTPALGEAGIARLAESMQDDGLDLKATGLVLLTHCHPDHCEAANSVREDSGALVAVHEAEVDLLRQGGCKVDLVLVEGDLKLGPAAELELRILHVPGHSPGHIAIYWPRHKVLIAGDNVFFRSVGRVDLPGGDVRAMARSLRRLSELDADYVLCGHPYGHPGVIEGRAAVQENFESIQDMMGF